QIRNRHRFVLDCQRLTVVTPAMADFTGHVDIRQETHFDFAKTIPLTRFASPAFDIEAKTTSFVPPRARFWEHRVQLANGCEDAGRTTIAFALDCRRMWSTGIALRPD